MFTLKQKKQQKNKRNNNVKTPDVQNKPKGQSKKIIKTQFEDPFRYHNKSELLGLQQSQQVEAHLIEYLTKLRQSLPPKPAREGLAKTIKFETGKNIKPKLSPLTTDEIGIGVKKTKRIVYSHHKKQAKKQPQITVVFYEEKKHDVLQQLLCLLKFLHQPYILLRENTEINRLLGVRTVGSLCFMNEEFSNKLLKFVGRSLIQVPWLLDLKEVIQDPENLLKNKGG